jgi:hypothetical protein
LIITPIVMLVATWWVWGLRDRMGTAVPAAALALLIAEQLVPLPKGSDRRIEEARFAQIPAPPSDRRVFVATRAREGFDLDPYTALYSHNVDAMMTASLMRLPTINGISTFVPPGWNLRDPQLRIYRSRVLAEADRQGLTLCGLDFATLRWSPTGDPFAGVPKPASILQITRGQTIPVGRDSNGIAELLMSGWSSVEADGVWSVGPDAVLTIPIGKHLQTGVIRVELWGFSNDEPIQKVQLRLRTGEPVSERISTRGPQTVQIPFSGSDVDDGVLRVSIAIAKPQAPRNSSDARLLGVSLRSIGID